ncbi:MAG: MgtC/SapB family protein [Planctomycetota bacterium]|nr:MAG: MgtC/SapB family protein [Planctomycetota bacterium]
MELSGAFPSLGIAVGLGLLVGLQRERVGASAYIGGVRTFALVTVLGATTGMLVPVAGPWLLVAAFLGVAATGLLSNVLWMRRGDPEPGMTSEIAMMVMFVVGALVALGLREVGVALGVGTAILLQLKGPLHGLASKLGDADVRAVLQFALITFIVLPILPDTTYGPFDVLNPYRVWLMVVLVVGLSLAGYVAFRLLGRERGTLVAGLVGGLISSTATTVSYSRLGKRSAAVRGAACAVFLLATFVMYCRVIAEVWIVSPTHARQIVGPIAIVAAATMVCAALCLLRAGKQDGEMPEQENPAELKSALVFGGLYAVILFLVAAAKAWFGDAGLYAVAGVSGLTDMDAITLSAGRLVERGMLVPETAWRAVLIASLSNLAFKWGIVWVLGGRAMARQAAGWFAAVGAVSVVMLLVW